MQMTEIREMAKSFGLKTARANKESLVKQIQLAEGNFSCFASAVDGICDQADCIWQKDCFSAAKKKN